MFSTVVSSLSPPSVLVKGSNTSKELVNKWKTDINYFIEFFCNEDFWWENTKINSLQKYLTATLERLIEGSNFSEFFLKKEGGDILVSLIYRNKLTPAISFDPLLALQEITPLKLRDIRNTVGYENKWQNKICKIVLPFTPSKVIIQLIPETDSLAETLRKENTLSEMVHYFFWSREAKIILHDSKILENRSHWERFEKISNYFLEAFKWKNFEKLIECLEQEKSFILLNTYKIIYISSHPKREKWLSKFKVEELKEFYKEKKIKFNSPHFSKYLRIDAATYYKYLNEYLNSLKEPSFHLENKILADQELQLKFREFGDISLNKTSDLFKNIFNVNNLAWRTSLILSLNENNEELVAKTIEEYDDLSLEGCNNLVETCKKIIHKWPSSNLLNYLKEFLKKPISNESHEIINNYLIENLPLEAICSQNDSTFLPYILHLMEKPSVKEKIIRFSLEEIFLKKISQKFNLHLQNSINYEMTESQTEEINAQIESEGKDLLDISQLISQVFSTSFIPEFDYLKFLEFYLEKSSRSSILFNSITNFILNNQDKFNLENSFAIIYFLVESCIWEAEDFQLVIEKLCLRHSDYPSELIIYLSKLELEHLSKDFLQEEEMSSIDKLYIEIKHIKLKLIKNLSNNVALSLIKKELLDFKKNLSKSKENLDEDFKNQIGKISYLYLSELTLKYQDDFTIHIKLFEEITSIYNIYQEDSFVQIFYSFFSKIKDNQKNNFLSKIIENFKIYTKSINSNTLIVSIFLHFISKEMSKKNKYKYVSIVDKNFFLNFDLTKFNYAATNYFYLAQFFLIFKQDIKKILSTTDLNRFDRTDKFGIYQRFMSDSVNLFECFFSIENLKEFKTIENLEEFLDFFNNKRNLNLLKCNNSLIDHCIYFELPPTVSLKWMEIDTIKFMIEKCYCKMNDNHLNLKNLNLMSEKIYYYLNLIEKINEPTLIYSSLSIIFLFYKLKIFNIEKVSDNLKLLLEKTFKRQTSDFIDVSCYLLDCLLKEEDKDFSLALSPIINDLLQNVIKKQIANAKLSVDNSPNFDEIARVFYRTTELVYKYLQIRNEESSVLQKKLIILHNSLKIIFKKEADKNVLTDKLLFYINKNENNLFLMDLKSNM